MSISCVFRYRGSDSLQKEVVLQCLPSVGEKIYFDGNEEVVVHSIHHEISENDKIHKVVITYSSSTKPIGILL